MTSHVLDRAVRRDRSLAFATAALFLVSSLFPVAAGLTHDLTVYPAWWGAADVSLAFLLAIMATAVQAVGQRRMTSEIETATYRAYRVLLHGILGLCAVFFIAGDRIVWIQCLTGFAWRSWLLAYCLPGWLACVGGSRVTGTSMRGGAEM
jgi:hypothetical protein